MYTSSCPFCRGEDGYGVTQRTTEKAQRCTENGEECGLLCVILKEGADVRWRQVLCTSNNLTTSTRHREELSSGDPVSLCERLCAALRKRNP